ncbi:DUF441 domain-containing protein [Brevibacillus laterosporus]|uniref:UPF0756 membrane protein EEL30_22345 n=1 Tax=Brevibacillus laterosporus TaxID=1465 RepID=A0A502IBC7_BRELA|nr:DUF441 domain-containing protein [Brevibacillus laterosporus]QDX94785.1 DUF441 domain-containing protein [Brevibacillus laterosporus]RAP23945.1 hypothetical protein C2W64_03023 [Brevibacillus laterosporus]TPG68483.1 DUF441 domain-containing protein [Brevibacillus laterosporus]TPG82550.1 DUF441 domain-containing protein [Brevibacillus laterosporus]
MDITSLLLLLLLGLAIVGSNNAVAIAVSFLLFVRLLQLERVFPFLEQNGLHIGIIILTIGVMTPLASGKITPQMIWGTFTNWQSLLAVVIGIFVAYLGGRGAGLMTTNPVIVTGLLVGTIVGVSLFKGVPVGPLIAAGIVSLLLQVLPK